MLADLVSGEVLAVSSWGRGGEGLSGASFLRALVPFMRALPSGLITPKAPSSCQYMNFRVHKHIDHNKWLDINKANLIIFGSVCLHKS